MHIYQSPTQAKHWRKVVAEVKLSDAAKAVAATAAAAKASTAAGASPDAETTQSEGGRGPSGIIEDIET